MGWVRAQVQDDVQQWLLQSLKHRSHFKGGGLVGEPRFRLPPEKKSIGSGPSRPSSQHKGDLFSLKDKVRE